MSINQLKNTTRLSHVVCDVDVGDANVRYYAYGAQAVTVFKRPCLPVTCFHLHFYSAEKKKKSVPFI